MKISQLCKIRRTAVALSVLLLTAGCEPVETSSSTPTTKVTIREAPVQQAESVSPQILAQVQGLTKEIGGLRDRVEILEFELEKARERQKELYHDVDLRLRKFERLQSQSETSDNVVQPDPESTGQPVSSDSSSQAIDASDGETESSSQEILTDSEEITPQPPVPDVNPQVVREIYDDAFRTLKEGRYDDSKVKFQVLINNHPNSELVDDAWYWIAEANYITKKYDQAIRIFQYVAREFPENQRSAEALLKIGYIYYDLKNFEEAQLYLNEVVDNYPASRTAFSARRRLDKMKRDGVI